MQDLLKIILILAFLQALFSLTLYKNIFNLSLSLGVLATIIIYSIKQFRRRERY